MITFIFTFYPETNAQRLLLRSYRWNQPANLSSSVQENICRYLSIKETNCLWRTHHSADDATLIPIELQLYKLIAGQYSINTYMLSGDVTAFGGLLVKFSF